MYEFFNQIILVSQKGLNELKWIHHYKKKTTGMCFYTWQGQIWMVPGFQTATPDNLPS